MHPFQQNQANFPASKTLTNLTDENTATRRPIHLRLPKEAKLAWVQTVNGQAARAQDLVSRKPWILDMVVFQLVDTSTEVATRDMDHEEATSREY